ncbi:hypothetical protein, partial [Trichlorobacter lovleyi]|uniref:hypothetical protein n=1 Tax=Trichlorobacter lovleyi TaxID=313985 RepID=UPI002FDE0BA6
LLGPQFTTLAIRFSKTKSILRGFCFVPSQRNWQVTKSFFACQSLFLLFSLLAAAGQMFSVQKRKDVYLRPAAIVNAIFKKFQKTFLRPACESSSNS